MSKILIIDDEKSIRNTLKEILEYENYEIEEAKDSGRNRLLLAVHNGRTGTVFVTVDVSEED